MAKEAKRIPIWLGNMLTLSMTALTIFTAVNVKIAIVQIICWFMLIYFPHCLSHYVVGRLLGIRFRYYYLSRSMLSKAGIPFISKVTSVKAFLTLRLDCKPRGVRGFLMYISGPLASMSFPAITVFTSTGIVRYVLAVMTIGNAMFSGYYSYKYGCIRKAINALKP